MILQHRCQTDANPNLPAMSRKGGTNRVLRIFFLHHCCTDGIYTPQKKTTYMPSHKTGAECCPTLGNNNAGWPMDRFWRPQPAPAQKKIMTTTPAPTLRRGWVLARGDRASVVHKSWLRGCPSPHSQPRLSPRSTRKNARWCHCMTFPCALLCVRASSQYSFSLGASSFKSKENRSIIFSVMDAFSGLKPIGLIFCAKVYSISSCQASLRQPKFSFSALASHKAVMRWP